MRGQRFDRMWQLYGKCNALYVNGFVYCALLDFSSDISPHQFHRRKSRSAGIGSVPPLLQSEKSVPKKQICTKESKENETCSAQLQEKTYRSGAYKFLQIINDDDSFAPTLPLKILKTFSRGQSRVMLSLSFYLTTFFPFTT